MRKIHTAIIGGGASGMFCAANLARSRGVVIFERGERLGRKLSATGNGQGNITNEHVGEVAYFSFLPEFLPGVDARIRAHGKRELLGFLESLGGLFLPDERGRVYPAGRQASAITDLLRFAIEKKGVGIETNTKAVELKKTGGGFLVETETPSGREIVFAKNVVLCAGGKAAKNFGTDGNGYSLARSLGHTVTPLYPSLVQLKTDTETVKTLKGIRINSAEVTAFDGGKSLKTVRGDIIFTDYGVSGDAIFRLSAFVTDKIENGKISLSVDLLPEVGKERLSDVLGRKKERLSDLPETELLCGILNNQVGRAVMKRCKGEDIFRVAEEIKGFSLRVTGSLGFDYAQVTKGGIPLSETDENLQSLFAEGLYFAGEILDVDGECGGYNLQWAYSSARTVAEAINAAEDEGRKAGQ